MTLKNQKYLWKHAENEIFSAFVRDFDFFILFYSNRMQYLDIDEMSVHCQVCCANSWEKTEYATARADLHSPTLSGSEVLQPIHSKPHPVLQKLYNGSAMHVRSFRKEIRKY